MSHYRLVVLSEAVPGQEEAYDTWYNTQHLGDVLRIPGFVAAQRFRLLPNGNGPQPPAGNLAIYEIESDDIDGTMRLLSETSRTGDMPMSDALDRSNTRSYVAVPVTARIERDVTEA